jgi:hypothetical protein
VVALLGEPDYYYLDYSPGRNMAYENGLLDRLQWLVVRFDDAWLVTGVSDFQG